MKIQIVKKGSTKAGADSVCPWFIDVPMAATKKS
jgi:hypothetical protein